MKISTETRELLAFAGSLNNSFTFNSGSNQSQLSSSKNQAIFTELKEDIPCPFLLTDLKKLNGLLGKLRDAEISFSENNYISVREGRRFEYRLEIEKHDEKEIKEPSPSEKWSWTIEGIFISKRTLSTLMTIAD
jgi:hypothetical protein